MWVGGVVEYMSDSWYWWCYHTEGQCGLVLWWSTCQDLGTGDVTILRVSVGWWCSGLHVRLLVLVVTILRAGWVGGVVEYMLARLLVLVMLPY